MTPTYTPSRRPWFILIVIVAVFGVIALIARSAAPPTPFTGGDAGTIHVQGDFTLASDHPGDLVVIGQNITLPEGVTAQGAVSLVGAAITIGGRVDGDLTAIGEVVTVLNGAQIGGEVAILAQNIGYEGRAGGSVRLNAGIVELLPGAAAAGDVIACTDQLTNRADGLTLTECTDREQLAPFTWLIELAADNPNAVIDSVAAAVGPGATLLGVLAALSLTALSALMVTAFPRRTDRIAQALSDRPGRYWGAGIAFVVVFTGGLIALMVVLGIFPPLGFLFMPVCFVGLIAFMVLGIAGMASVARVTGDRVIARLSRRPEPPIVAAAVGGALIAGGLGALSLLPLGGAIALIGLALIASIGIGATAFTRFGQR